MGVVRDVTIDQLTQAVTGISTSGMSDSTGQAINTTLGTLGKDTSLQEIKTAINNLSSAISALALDLRYVNLTGTTDANGNLSIDRNTLEPTNDIILSLIPNRFTTTTAFFTCGIAVSNTNDSYIIHCVRLNNTSLDNTSVNIRCYYKHI